ncbi:hypothetical protein GCM10028857_29400 [Salinarchaeum chitinilyticum]
MGAPGLPDVVEVDGEVLPEHVRAVDEEADAGFDFPPISCSAVWGAIAVGSIARSEQSAEPSHASVCERVANRGVDATQREIGTAPPRRGRLRQAVTHR